MYERVGCKSPGRIFWLGSVKKNFSDFVPSSEYLFTAKKKRGSPLPFGRAQGGKKCFFFARIMLEIAHEFSCLLVLKRGL